MVSNDPSGCFSIIRWASSAAAALVVSEPATIASSSIANGWPSARGISPRIARAACDTSPISTASMPSSISETTSSVGTPPIRLISAATPAACVSQGRTKSCASSETSRARVAAGTTLPWLGKTTTSPACVDSAAERIISTLGLSEAPPLISAVAPSWRKTRTKPAPCTTASTVLLALVHSGGLGAHVDRAEGADFGLLVEPRVGQLGLGGVEVDAQALAIGGEHQRLVGSGVALERRGGDVGERDAQLLEIGYTGHDELGAEAVEAFAAVEPARQPGGVDVAEILRGGGQRVAARAGQHPAQHHLEPARAGVDHAGVGEHLIELRRALDGGVGLGHGDIQQVDYRVGLMLGGDRSGFAGDADHRALARLGDRGAGGLRGSGQRGLQQRHIDALVTLQGAGEPAQPLRTDHARAAAGAEQRRIGGRGGDLGQRCALRNAIKRAS